MIVALLAMVLDNTDGFKRLEGSYSGPMEFHDDFDNNDKSFVVDLTIKLGSNSEESTWFWTFNFDPPKSSQSVETVTVSKDGKFWHENDGATKLDFKLKNWDAFRRGRSQWFEVSRPVAKQDGTKGLFRRRYTISKQALISEKWLKYGSGSWYRSHKMTLKRNKI